MDTIRPLILLGGGGHCKSVIDVAECAEYTILGILDRPEEVGKRVLGYEVIGVDADVMKYADIANFVVTVGQIKSPALRIKLHQMLENAGCKLATIISPLAHVSKYATIGEGTVIMHQVVINADAKVGKGCIINTFANIEHDAEIGDFCHISTGSFVNGDCCVGENVFLGSNSVVANGIKICADCVIGAGSTIYRDITDKGVYVMNSRICNKVLVNDLGNRMGGGKQG